MDYIIGALCGLVFGAGAGLAKYILLWQPLMRGRRPCDQRRIMTAQGVSMAVNVAALLGIFFLRPLLPFPYEAALIATAVALSLMGRFSPLRDAKILEKLSAAEQEKRQ